ncbi:MAG: citrate synthase [Kiritimatiellae bacterium]|nr:citrate synthase [Kiritimatiellia bacterium]
MNMTYKKVSEGELKWDDQHFPMDVLEGSENERAIDIRKLRGTTGLITYDPGYVNSGACQSSITFIDGQKGILRYRGYDIAELSTHCTFIEVAYLLIHGNLPNRDELGAFSKLLTEHAAVEENLAHSFRHYPENAHPMAILSAMVVSLSTWHPEVEVADNDLDKTVTQILAKVRTLASCAHQQSRGETCTPVPPKFDYVNDAMMFTLPLIGREMNPVLVQAIDKLLILHADHEQNCSTSVVRMVGSSGANLHASISSGICALWGPLHGGANQAVIEMLEDIYRDGGDVNKAVEKTKDKNANYRLMGFGHRVYKTYDPRAKIAKKACKEVLDHLGVEDPLLDIAMQLEEKALSDSYFQDRNLYPNIDFYTGITYRAMGFSPNMFTVLFALGRLPGWIAHWLELKKDPENRIGRPRQIYTGPNARETVSIEER